jgi:tRNA/rRNA methyltransferase
VSHKPIIILVEPQLGENIGFIARIMGNFGFSELRIVNPRDGWPNDSAKATATKASYIIDSAKIFDSFEKAVSDLRFLYASTARPRDCNKDCIEPSILKQDITNIEAQTSEIGIIFGPERSGLDNKIVTKCNKIIQIPTTAKVPSLNIAIAASIICYELSSLSLGKKPIEDLSTQDQKEFFIDFLEDNLEKSNFFKTKEKRQKTLQNISNIFNRVPNLTSNEVNTLLGIVKSLAEYSK